MIFEEIVVKVWSKHGIAEGLVDAIQELTASWEGIESADIYMDYMEGHEEE